MSIEEIVGTIIRGEQAVKFPLELVSFSDGWVQDANKNHILDIRGWGRFQYHGDGEGAAEKLQDAFAEWIVNTLNAEAQRLGLITK